jgi:hypothetical protein
MPQTVHYENLATHSLLPWKLSSPHQHAESHSYAQARGDELKSVSPMKTAEKRVI